MKDYEKNINQFINNYKDDMFDYLNTLINIESISKDDEFKPFGKECYEVVNKATQIGEGLNLKSENHDYYGLSLLLGKGEKEIAILTHLDIVPVSIGWSVPPFELTKKNGLLYGRGVADDKGATIIAMYAMKFLDEMNIKLNYTYRLFMGCSEERDMRCIDYYVKNVKQPVFAISPDMKFPVCAGEKGIVDFIIKTDCPREIESIKGGSALNVVPSYCECRLSNQKIIAHGIAAHGSTPEEGVNAITQLCKDIVAKKNVSDEFKKLVKNIIIMSEINGKGFGILKYADKTGNVSVSLGTIDKKDNELYLGFNIRYPVYGNSKEIENHLLNTVNKFGFKIVKNIDNKPSHVDINSNEVKCLLQALKIVTGKEEKPYYSSGGSYARKVKNAVAFGPILTEKSFGNPHMIDECMYEKDFFDALKIYIYSLLLLNEIK